MNDSNPEHLIQLREQKIANLLHRVDNLEHKEKFVMYMLNNIIKAVPGLHEKIIEMTKENVGVKDE